MSKRYFSDYNQDALAKIDTLRSDVGACCVLLIDLAGHTLIRSGGQEVLAMEEISALLGGSISALVQAGQLLQDQQKRFSLIYQREGHRYHLFGINVGEKLLMTMLIPKTQFTTQMGAVIHYSQRTAKDLDTLLKDVDFSSSPADLPVEFEATLTQQLHALFA